MAAALALGHPFGATGARILSQAVKELAASRPKGRTRHRQHLRRRRPGHDDAVGVSLT
jgi:acetyl-CoA acetyltransferase